ncbi:MAG: D-alanyl-D-alanine carboxypeptidase [Desulfomonile tiedjei]|uniref:D-alanyl-D-alanine carboxypeptidase n=1 Tax=Desulfomonile tiedjei TaxID=2358 RepID=A0A9D6YYM6_9BACT|nr:D-alanyl-D-alanine carboxypeptidase [Desulfomonile tiedjei]
MFLRFMVLTIGLLLLNGGLASAFEPVRTSASINEMMSGSRPGAAVNYQHQRKETSLHQKSTIATPAPRASQPPRPSTSSVAYKPKTLIAMPAPKQNLSLERSINASTAKSAHLKPTLHGKPLASVRTEKALNGNRPPVKAKALYCVDCSSNKVVLAENTCAPLPIASITKLLTAMVIVEEMDLDRVVEVPEDIGQVERHVVGLKPGDQLTVRDLLHGMLIESGNDCAEALARAYPKGGREAFMGAMNRKAAALGASSTSFYTPSGLDSKMTLGRKDGRYLEARKANTASAEDVAAIARAAFKNPLISKISSTRTYTMRTRNFTPRDYPLVSNDKLLTRNLPLVGAKTGYTNLAGKCIVALFKHNEKEHMVVVLNSPNHFKAAEKVYRWAHKPM